MQYKKLIGTAAALTTALAFVLTTPITASACNNGHHAKCHCKAEAHKCARHHCGCKTKKQAHIQAQSPNK
jgi:hypothetical protein